MIRLLTFLVLAGFALFVARDWAGRHPEHLPWTPLDLAASIGWATADKLAALAGDPARCRGLLTAAGVRATPVPDRAGACPLRGAVRVSDLGLPLDPGGVVMTCPLAAATVVWAREVVRPAARARFGTNPVALNNLGTYSCRNIAGSTRRSEHAGANALDIAGVDFARGRSISLVGDWSEAGPRAAFLRDLRDGGCRVFGAVLGPDYNRAHADHFHLDMGRWRICR